MMLSAKEQACIRRVLKRRVPPHKTPLWDVDWWLGRTVVFDDVTSVVIHADVYRGVRTLTLEARSEPRPLFILSLVQANIWLALGVISLPN